MSAELEELKRRRVQLERRRLEVMAREAQAAYELEILREARASGRASTTMQRLILCSIQGKLDAASGRSTAEQRPLRW